MGSMNASEDRGKELVEYLSLLCVCWSHFSLLIYLRGYILLGLSILSSVPVEPLPATFLILHQVQFHLHLAFLDLFPACPDSIPVFFPGHIALLSLPVHILSFPPFDQQVLVQLCQFPASSVWFPMLEHGEPVFLGRWHWRPASSVSFLCS